MWSYFVLGVIQGLFEWLPISSEGMVALASQFLIKEINPLEVAIFLHLGTLLAVLIYFRKDWLEILRLKNNRLLNFLIIATLVSLAVGYPLYNLVFNLAIGSSLLLIMGFGLLFTAYFHKSKKTSEISSRKLALITGILQGLAVIPGLSRSGATIFGLSLGKFNPKEVLKVSYMMSAPVTLAGAGFIFLRNPSFVLDGWPALILSFLVGIITLGFLIKLASKIDFFKFALFFAALCFLGAAVGFFI
ncbi:MAG: undecaprenyl-diphosphate phosphatase [bacterium]